MGLSKIDNKYSRIQSYHNHFCECGYFTTIKMKKRYLNATKQGESDYDPENDLFIIRIKNRDYLKSIDYDDIIIDLDKELYITGIRIFAASKKFRLSKKTLSSLRSLEFNAKIEDNTISIVLKISTSVLNFSRELIHNNINDSSVFCTA